MARPLKTGLEYYPKDTDTFGKRKILRLLNEYGCTGYTTYDAIVCEIYGGNGYYTSFTNDFCFDIGFTLKQPEKLVAEIIQYCAEIGLFDRQLLEQKQILTSCDIQQRFMEIMKRSRPQINPEFFLAETSNCCIKTSINVTTTPVIAAETPVNVTKTPPKGKGKGKEIKRNKEEESILEYFNTSFSGRLPRVIALTSKRRTAINARLKEHGMSQVMCMLKTTALCPFLLGENKSGWRAGFDWLFSPLNFIKVLEGNYLNQHQHEQPKTNDSGSAQRKAEIIHMAALAAANDRNP